jgi:cobyric acid synthase CobQ
MIQVLGTSSSAGKSTLTMALCRHFSNLGFKVAPFKSVNMSLNSVATGDGIEISRSVWLQCNAARVEPVREMNPFLLKPEGMGGSQVISLGVSRGIMTISQYRKYMAHVAPENIKKSIHALSNDYDIIIAEGAGSPAEINLEGDDFANTFVSALFDTPCILITDIDRGGAFASLYGTLKLMRRSDLVKWFVINRMSGDSRVLEPGIKYLENTTGKEALGVVPKMRSIDLPGEDSLDYLSAEQGTGNIAVIRYPYMENYSDVDPLRLSGLGFSYVDGSNPTHLDSCSLIILPGSKNVAMDLAYLRDTGLDSMILRQKERGCRILGICGGYQMLGKTIAFNEDSATALPGLALLNCRTVYSKNKTVKKVNGKLNREVFDSDDDFSGYEIHYGLVSSSDKKFVAVTDSQNEGSVSEDGSVIGTNIHSLLENKTFLRYLTGFRQSDFDYLSILENNIEKVTENFISHMNMKPLLSYIEEK